MSDAVPQLNERDIFLKSQLASQRSVLYEGSFSQKNTKNNNITSKKQIFAPECDALNLAHCCATCIRELGFVSSNVCFCFTLGFGKIATI